MNNYVRWALSQWNIPHSARICLAFMMDMELNISYSTLAFVKECPVSSKTLNSRVFAILEKEGYIKNYKKNSKRYFILLKKDQQTVSETINPTLLSVK